MCVWTQQSEDMLLVLKGFTGFKGGVFTGFGVGFASQERAPCWFFLSFSSSLSLLSTVKMHRYI